MCRWISDRVMRSPYSSASGSASRNNPIEPCGSCRSTCRTSPTPNNDAAVRPGHRVRAGCRAPAGTTPPRRRDPTPGPDRPSSATDLPFLSTMDSRARQCISQPSWCRAAASPAASGRRSARLVEVSPRRRSRRCGMPPRSCLDAGASVMDQQRSPSGPAATAAPIRPARPGSPIRYRYAYGAHGAAMFQVPSARHGSGLLYAAPPAPSVCQTSAL